MSGKNTNRFELMKEDFRNEYPSIKSLGVLRGLAAKFSGRKHHASKTFENEVGSFTQWAELIEYDGKEYLAGFRAPDGLS